MSLQQSLAFGLVALTIGAFIWGRFRYDLVAVTALVLGLAVGIIPADKAFDGFKNDVTVIIACALVVSAAFARSGIVELAMRRVLPLLKTERSQAPVLTTAVTVLSMATKNVGALAIMMPVALQVARRTGTSPSRLLMPMAFGAMAGGMVTLVGTAPNIIVAEVRQDILGRPFSMYDYAPVGLALTAVALVFLAVAYRLLPKDRQGATSLKAALAANSYATEARVPADWACDPLTVSGLSEMSSGEVRLLALIREGKRNPSPHFNVRIRPGDTLMLEGEQEALEELIARAKFKLVREDKPVAIAGQGGEISIIEAVIGRNSPLEGQSARKSDLYS
ncbi:MAG: SLC13 family permease, partial [Caulobacteraceae bacterium]